MFRKLLTLAVTAVLPASAQNEPLRALPVDPSEITPEESVKPAQPAAPAAPVAEVTPLAPGAVTLPERKVNPRSDTPAIDNLPGGEDAVRLQIFLDQ